MSKKIVLVGEAFGEREEEVGRPFVGPSGKLLDSFLSAHGLARSECYITNVFNFRPSKNPITASSIAGPKSDGIPGWPSFGKGKYVRKEFSPEIDRLHREIRDCNPTLVVALGGVACWALLRDNRIKRLRGSPSRGVTGHKVFPTYHPAAVLREFKLRPVVFSDFGKIRRESEFREIRRPAREFWLYPTLDDLAAFEGFILSAPKLSVDIETWAGQITCIGFAPSPSLAIVIPFVCKNPKDGNYWRTKEEELLALTFVRRWLNLGLPLVGQNFNYDMSYAWRHYGITIREVDPQKSNLPLINDTMLLHHAMQPEMEKSLALLSTLYTDEPQHKFMRQKSSTLKAED